MAKLKRDRSTNGSDDGFEEEDVDVPKVKKAKNVKESKKSNSSGETEKGEPYWEVHYAMHHSKLQF
jgi:uncharacterized protein YpmB